MKQHSGSRNNIDQIITIYEHHLTPAGTGLLKDRKTLLEEITGHTPPDELCPYLSDFSEKESI